MRERQCAAQQATGTASIDGEAGRAGGAPTRGGHGCGIGDGDVDHSLVDHIGSGNQRHDLRTALEECGQRAATHSTTALEAKFEPFTAIWKSALPAPTLEGVMDIMLGLEVDGPMMGKFMEGEAVSRLGRLTATLAKPAVARSPWVTSTVTVFEFMNVAGRCEPLKTTTSPTAKFEPFTVSVKGMAPILALGGLNEAITGSPGWGITTVKVLLGPQFPPAAAQDPPGGGFATVIVAMPATATSEGRMETANSPVWALRLVERAEPFQ